MPQTVKIFLWDYLFLHFYVYFELFTRAKYSFLVKDTSSMKKKKYTEQFFKHLGILPSSILSSLFLSFILRGKKNTEKSNFTNRDVLYVALSPLQRNTHTCSHTLRHVHNVYILQSMYVAVCGYTYKCLCIMCFSDDGVILLYNSLIGFFFL